MAIINVAEAKNNLSKLLDAAVAGEEVIIARNGTPVALLVPVREPAPRQLGFLPASTPDDRFAPLTGDELHGWT